MRLIDADALKEAMYHEAFEKDTDMQKWDGGCWIRYKMFENKIKEAPTIEERKTGRWNEDGTCSVCGTYSSLNLTKVKYCPECGAEMEGGAE